MAHKVVAPPAVEKSRDLPTIIAAVLSLVLLCAGFIVGMYCDRWSTGLALIALAILGCVAVGLRLLKVRKTVTDNDLEENNDEEENEVIVEED